MTDTETKNGKGSEPMPPPEAKIIPITRTRFLSPAGKPKSRIVDLPEFADEVTGEIPSCRIRAMTGGEQDYIAQMSETVWDQEKNEARMRREPVRARVLAWCVLDVNTSLPLFSIEDVNEIAEVDAAIMTRLYQVVLDLSTRTSAEVEKVREGFPKTPDAKSSTN